MLAGQLTLVEVVQVVGWQSVDHMQPQRQEGGGVVPPETPDWSSAVKKQERRERRLNIQDVMSSPFHYFGFDFPPFVWASFRGNNVCWCMAERVCVCVCVCDEENHAAFEDDYRAASLSLALLFSCPGVKLSLYMLWCVCVFVFSIQVFAAMPAVALNVSVGYCLCGSSEPPASFPLGPLDFRLYHSVCCCYVICVIPEEWFKESHSHTHTHTHRVGELSNNVLFQTSVSLPKGKPLLCLS